MKASEAIIAWNGFEDFRSEGRPGAIAVGPLLFDGDSDWTRPYLFTAGAAEVYRRSLPDKDQHFAVLKDFYSLVQVYGLHPYLVHRAFMHIDEYRDLAAEMGVAEEHTYAVPSVEEDRIERSFHFWTAA
jgi:hypothetical protein